MRHLFSNVGIAEHRLIRQYRLPEQPMYQQFPPNPEMVPVRPETLNLRRDLAQRQARSATQNPYFQNYAYHTRPDFLPRYFSAPTSYPQPGVVQYPSVPQLAPHPLARSQYAGGLDLRGPWRAEPGPPYPLRNTVPPYQLLSPVTFNRDYRPAIRTPFIDYAPRPTYPGYLPPTGRAGGPIFSGGLNYIYPRTPSVFIPTPYAPSPYVPSRYWTGGWYGRAAPYAPDFAGTRFPYIPNYPGISTYGVRGPDSRLIPRVGMGRGIPNGVPRELRRLFVRSVPYPVPGFPRRIYW